MHTELCTSAAKAASCRCRAMVFIKRGGSFERKYLQRKGLSRHWLCVKYRNFCLGRKSKSNHSKTKLCTKTLSKKRCHNKSNALTVCSEYAAGSKDSTTVWCLIRTLSRQGELSGNEHFCHRQNLKDSLLWQNYIKNKFREWYVKVYMLKPCCNREKRKQRCKCCEPLGIKKVNPEVE